MKSFYCERCASPRFLLTDMENGVIEAKCIICEKMVKFKKMEETKE